MTGAVTADPGVAARLRDEGVDKLIADGWVTSGLVEAAMRKVPRHIFAPGVPLEESYGPYTSVVTRRDEHGISVSSVSAPYIQAMMLEQAGIAPRMRVLEVGSGGYNAALLAEITGTGGEVTTVDIDPEVTARASRFLAEAGYPQVRVVLGDAEAGVPEHAPYDAIVVTAGSWDIPPAWISQLAAPAGRLVVPLRMRGLTRSVAFIREEGHLGSVSARICGFVPVQGAGAHQQQVILVSGTGEIALRFDDEPPRDPHLLDGAISSKITECWTGVTVRRMEPYDQLQLYLASVLPGFCVMVVDPELDSGRVRPSNRGFSMAVADGGSFAYVTTRRLEGDPISEFGVHALGPGGQVLAAKVAGHIRDWDREQRGGPGPRIDVWPATTPADRLPAGPLIAKAHTRIMISWPPPEEPHPAM